MKLGLITAALVFALGCSSTKGPPVVQPTPEPAVVTPVAAVPAPASNPTDDPDRTYLRGDSWELSINTNGGWRRMRTDGPELALVNFSSHTLVLLTKEEYVDSLENYTKHVIEEFSAQGGNFTLQQGAFVNTRRATLLEGTLGRARVLVWNITTGAEGYTLSCGGSPEAFEGNVVVCKDLAKHFYIGKTK